MTDLLLLINSVIFLLLSALHIYWLAGGKWALQNALPQKAGTSEVIKQPGNAATLIVALGLATFAVVTFANIDSGTYVPTQMARYSLLGIGIIFLMRTIGDFKYIGLSKRINDTPFALADKRIYVPLCAYIGISSIICFVYAA